MRTLLAVGLAFCLALFAVQVSGAQGPPGGHGRAAHAAATTYRDSDAR